MERMSTLDAGFFFVEHANVPRHLLEGVEAGRWAILNEVHHCMVDGIGGTDLMAEIFDLPPGAGPPVQPIAGEPQQERSPEGTMPSSLGDAVTWPLRLVACVPGLVRQQLPSRATLAAFVRGRRAWHDSNAGPGEESRRGVGRWALWQCMRMLST